MKKNNVVLVLAFVSISLLIMLSIIQGSMAQRDDNDHRHHDRQDDYDDDHNRDDWNIHKDYDKWFDDGDFHNLFDYLNDYYDRYYDDNNDNYYDRYYDKYFFNDDYNYYNYFKYKYNYDDYYYDHEEFVLTVKLISSSDRHNMPDYIITGPRVKYIDGEEFENDGKVKVKFLLDKSDLYVIGTVCVMATRNFYQVCEYFDTSRGNSATVNFHIN